MLREHHYYMHGCTLLATKLGCDSASFSACCISDICKPYGVDGWMDDVDFPHVNSNDPKGLSYIVTGCRSCFCYYITGPQNMGSSVKKVTQDKASVNSISSLRHYLDCVKIHF